MKTIIHVSQAVIKRNRKEMRNDPPLIARTYKGVTHGHSIEGVGRPVQDREPSTFSAQMRGQSVDRNRSAGGSDMNIKSLFYGWLIPCPWNRKALEDFADFIEDHPEIAQPGDNILWYAARVFFVQCLHPISRQLDRGALAYHLRLPMWKIFHMAYPISEKQVPEGVTIGDITNQHVVSMLRRLARTGKVEWRIK